MINQFELTAILSEDKALIENPKQLMEFMSLANLFTDDTFEENLYLTSIELSEKYGGGSLVMWNNFLAYPPVRKFKERFIDEKKEVEANKLLRNMDAGKASDAVRMTELLESKKQKFVNENVIVFFMPQRKYGEMKAGDK